MKICVLSISLLFALLAKATEPIGQIVCHVINMPSNAAPVSSTWINTTGLIIYIHRAELHMLGPDGDQSFSAHIFRISDNSIFIMEGIYCSTESPHVYQRNFEPDYVSLKAGDGLLLKAAAQYPGPPKIPFSVYCVVWYSVGAP
jgi:hypothetical protein